MKRKEYSDNSYHCVGKYLPIKILVCGTPTFPQYHALASYTSLSSPAHQHPVPRQHYPISPPKTSKNDVSPFFFFSFSQFPCAINTPFRSGAGGSNRRPRDAKPSICPLDQYHIIIGRRVLRLIMAGWGRWGIIRQPGWQPAAFSQTLDTSQP